MDVQGLSREVSSYSSQSLLSRYEQASISERQQSGITIVTAEGDRVTLSSSQESSSSYSRYDRYAQLEGGSEAVSAEEYSLSSSSSFSISVEGELSEEELKDIQKAIKEAEKAMKNALNGDLEGALETALGFSQFTTLSSLEAYMQVEKSVSAQQVLTAKTQQSDSEQTQLPQNRAFSIDELKSLIEELSEGFKNSGIGYGMLQKPVASLFDSIVKEQQEEKGKEAPKAKLGRLIHEELKDRLNEQQLVREDAVQA